nr:FAD/NAD(P)-binding protein [Actinomadura rugatobispora]
MDAMTPVPYRVAARRADTDDTVTVGLEPVAAAIARPRPGQFTMMYAFGVGEVPISVSGVLPRIEQTVRGVGAVTRALCATETGGVIGLRGPFGTAWGIEEARGRDVVFAAGGIGLAPLRAAVLHALADRDSYGRITVMIGARTPEDLLYTAELDRWRSLGARGEVTVDRADFRWSGHVGLITALADRVEIGPAGAAAFVCGPEVMMRFTAEALVARGVSAADVRVSLERNMQCGVAWCGHCQLGPLLLCRDGPVVPYESAVPLMAVREL